MFRLGEVTTNGNGEPTRFYSVTESYLFPPGVNVRVIDVAGGGKDYAVQHNNNWLSLVAPRHIITKGDAMVVLLPAAAFNAAYTVTLAQDTEPLSVVEPPIEEPVIP